MVSRELVRLAIAAKKKGTPEEKIREELHTHDLTKEEVSHVLKLAHELMHDEVYQAQESSSVIDNVFAEVATIEEATAVRRVIACILDYCIVGFLTFYLSAIIFEDLLSYSPFTHTWILGRTPILTEPGPNLFSAALYTLLLFGYIKIIVNCIIVFCYFLLIQWKARRTLGQMLLGLEIVNAHDKKDPNFFQTVIRAMIPVLAGILALSTFTQFYSSLVIVPSSIFDIVWYFIRPGKQMFHDYLSGTKVIRG